ncbi:MAG: RNA polymerase sporulation sigma factor SigG [Bacilli bacterium]|nr:RNA polymerase sporulation sigma factor SigG [Bacilli bacterium]
MARHKVEICGVNTANIKVLSNGEMINLFKSYQSGNNLAKDELINGNLKLVLSILKKYNNRIDNLDDLFQVGCIGLIKAIDNFDLSHEVKFSTYAVPMILGEIKRYLRDNNSVRVARSIKDIAYKALKIKEDLTNKNNKEPSLEMIAKELGISEIEVSNALDSMKDTISMFEPIYNDGGDTIYLADQLEDKHNSLSDIETKISLKEAIKKLRDKEKYIIIARYLVGKTQMELADEIGISQAQISRIEKSGLNNIKKEMSA